MTGWPSALNNRQISRYRPSDSTTLNRDFSASFVFFFSRAPCFKFLTGFRGLAPRFLFGARIFRTEATLSHCPSTRIPFLARSRVSSLGFPQTVSAYVLVMP